MEEYIRGALPLFEPMEVEYNGGLCEETFQQCLDLNLFGPMDSMPAGLRGREVRWQFESPLQEAHERAKAQAFMQVAHLTQLAASADPAIIHDIDIAKSYRDAVTGTGAPADWLVPVEKAQPGEGPGRRKRRWPRSSPQRSAPARRSPAMSAPAFSRCSKQGLFNDRVYI